MHIEIGPCIQWSQKNGDLGSWTQMLGDRQVASSASTTCKPPSRSITYAFRTSVPTSALFSSLASATDTTEKYMKPSVSVIVIVDIATASHNVP